MKFCYEIMCFSVLGSFSLSLFVLFSGIVLHLSDFVVDHGDDGKSDEMEKLKQ